MALRACDTGSRGIRVVVVLDKVSVARSEEAQGMWDSEKRKCRLL